MQGMYDDAYVATRIICSDVGRGGEKVRDGEQVRRGGGRSQPVGPASRGGEVAARARMQSTRALIP